MPDFRSVIRERLRSSGLVPEREAEIVEELAEHLRDRYDSLCSAGATEAEALSAVAADLDQRDLTEELSRIGPAWSEPVTLGTTTSRQFWSALLQDLRYSLRTLRLSPGFTAVCIFSLALGIGANTAIFQLLDAVRMRVLPVPNPQELAVVRALKPWRSGHITGRFAYSTNPQWEQVRAHQQGFSGMVAWGSESLNLTTGGEVHPADGLWVSGSFFDVLQVEPLLGRVLHEPDDHPGCGAPGAVLSYAFWQRKFGGDPNVISKTMTLEGHPFPILGVTPASFYGVDVGHTFDIAVPLCSEPVIMGERSSYNRRDAWWLAILGRLKPGWSLHEASAQLQAISPAIMEETLPPMFQAEGTRKYLALRLGVFAAANGFSNIRREYETPLWLLLAIAALVLLIACANLANLMLARASVREREIAVRLALGAARGRLIRQLLTESLLLAFGGAILGGVLAQFLTRFLVHYLSSEDNSRIFLSLAIDWRVLSFSTALAMLTCVCFGLAPALTVTRADPARVISLAGRGLTAGRNRCSLRRALVVSQIALSIVLVVSALLFAGSLRKILTLNAGFEREGLLVMDVDFTRLALPFEQRTDFAQLLLDRVKTIPGVTSAAETSALPLGGNWWNDRVVVGGKSSEISVDMANVSRDYFKTMGTPQLAGRDFNAGDSRGAPFVAIVSQEFAQKFFNGQNPIGRTFKIDVNRGQPQPEYQIVGLVRNSKYFDLREDFAPIAYYAAAQDLKPDADTSIVVRSDLALDSLLASLRRTMADASPDTSIEFRVFDQEVRQGLLRERLLATLSGFFGVLAILLATIGLYGVIAYMVAQRSNEIGIRMALGALPSRVSKMIIGEAIQLLSIGLVVGLLLTLAAGKAASTLLYGLTSHDPFTLAMGSISLAVAGVLASLLPAKRAATMDPMAALRDQ
jgi:putative ABC transport system permease protein